MVYIHSNNEKDKRINVSKIANNIITLDDNSTAAVPTVTSNKCIAVRKVATPLRELTCHMGSHSVTCHPAEVTFSPLGRPITRMLAGRAAPLVTGVTNIRKLEFSSI